MQNGPLVMLNFEFLHGGIIQDTSLFILPAAAYLKRPCETEHVGGAFGGVPDGPVDR